MKKLAAVVRISISCMILTLAQLRRVCSCQLKAALVYRGNCKVQGVLTPGQWNRGLKRTKEGIYEESALEKAGAGYGGSAADEPDDSRVRCR